MWQGLSSALKFQKKRRSLEDGEHGVSKEESHPRKKQKDVAAKELEAVICVEDELITDEQDG